MLSPSKKDSPLLAAIAYPLGLIAALLVYLMEKEDKWVRFHALQALIFDLVFGAAYLVIFFFVWIFALVTFGLGALCVFPIFLVFPLVFLLRLWWAYRAYNGEYFEIPYIGEMAAKHI